jgi:uncharacterized membrane protein YgcG
MRLNGHGTLSLEDARTWIEETGLCLFLPKRQFSSSIAPSFVEAVAGRHDPVPDRKDIAVAEELLVRLETDGVAVRLNLLGLPGEAPDFVVASWVLPYVYALRGDRDWRRIPQLTGSRQVSQLAVQAYKLLESGGDTTLGKLTRALGREVTEAAVLRAITELWQQLRIIPVVSAPGQAAQWQLLRLRFQKAIAEGASTSQVTAISVLASIYLQAVIAASMEDVELFLAPLTARSKVREVLRGLVATRQVHTISLGHAPHFYVAGTLPEFATPPTIYASASIPASAYFLRSHDEELAEPDVAKQKLPAAPVPHKPAELHTPRTQTIRKPSVSGISATARPHFSRPATHTRDRKPAQSSSSSRPVQRAGASSAGGNGSNGTGGQAARPSSSGTRSSKSAASAWTPRNGSKRQVHSNSAKTPSKSGASSHKDSRTAARPARRVSSRKPALATSTKSGNGKRFGLGARPKHGAKKRG